MTFHIGLRGGVDVHAQYGDLIFLPMVHHARQHRYNGDGDLYDNDNGADDDNGDDYFNVVKYHLGKVKLNRVGQRSSPTPARDLRGGPRGIAGLLVCSFASVALHCSFAC